MNSVDKLFKSKLEGHQLTPSPKAWEKLESKLSKKNRTVIWFRVAAGLALMGLLAVAMLNWNSSSENSTLTKEDRPVGKREADPKPALTEKKNEEIVKPAIEEKKLKELLKPKGTSNPAENIAIMEPHQRIEQEQLVETSVASVLDESIKPVAAEEKTIVLVYSLPALPVESTATTETATLAEEAEQTGIQKIWEVAKDVKNSDNPWGDLREVKNELLALDFKRDKNKNSNN